MHVTPAAADGRTEALRRGACCRTGNAPATPAARGGALLVTNACVVLFRHGRALPLLAWRSRYWWWLLRAAPP